MNEQRSYRYLIYSLFLLSGVSGLIYQIVWNRMLVLVFGNTMLATATVLSAYMGGLAAGSYIIGKYIDRHPRPLIRLYAVLEAGVGLFALVFPFLIDAVTPVYTGLYSAVEGNIVLLNLFRFSVCFALIVIPTFLMGGTLPVLIKRFSTSTGMIGHETGFLYGLNTVGAVIGTIACGYFLLRIFGMQMTTWVAVTINLFVAAVAWIIGKNAVESPGSHPSSRTVSTPAPSAIPEYSSTTKTMVLIGIGISGFCALAYEVFWTRMLNLFLHNNIYSFTAILATFLVGIALGSLFYGKFLSRSRHQLRIFIWLQIGIGVISYATPIIFRMLHSGLFSSFEQSLTLAKTAVIMIGPTIMMGIAVPLAIQICQKGVSREGTSVGTVYAVNTVGSILGAFSAGFILLPTIGLHMGVIFLAGLNILAGFLPVFVSKRVVVRLEWGAVFVAIVAVMIISAPSHLFRDLFQQAHPDADIVYYKEGKVANVLVYDFKKLGYKDFHLNAVNEASSRLWHVQLFKMLGILPTLVHDDPSDALMIAFGAGMSAGACVRNVESLDCVDLNPDIRGIAEAYTRENLDVINQPNFRQIVNDGRNELMLNPRKYSLIISDATNPKMLDSWTLYSREFYQLVKDHLKPDGVFCQWAVIPLPGDAIKVILNTFRSVFPHMSFWVIHGSSQVLMLATPERLNIDYHELEQRLEPLYDKAGLAEFGIDSPEKLLSFFTLGEDGIAELLGDFDKVSTDNLPHAQFYIEQDSIGTDNCLDLVRYQESILKYMDQTNPPPSRFARRMATYEDIGRRLNLGNLTGNEIKYAEAEIIAGEAGLYDANVAHHRNYCPEKKRHFQARLATHPDDYTAHNWLGNIHLLSGEYEQAQQEFQAALRLKPDHAFALINLAMTHLETGEYDRATTEILQVRELSPTKRMLQSAGQQLIKARILRKLEFEPNNPSLISSLANAYYAEGQILRALRSFRQASAIGDNPLPALTNLARICEAHELVPQAAVNYSKLATAHPEEQQYAARAALFASLTDNPDGLRDWLNSRIVVPGQPASSDQHPPTCDEALALWNGADPDGAIDQDQLRKAAQLYQQSTRTKPDDLHAYIDAAVIYESLKDYDKAIQFWNDIFAIRPDLAVAPRHVSRLEAMAKLENPNTTGVERATTLRKVGSFYNELAEYERAAVYLRESVSIAPGQALAWQDLAQSAYNTGDYLQAIEAADRALAIQPDLWQAATIKNGLEKIVR